MKSFHFSIEKEYLLIYLAKAKAVANFANSAGCILNCPICSQDRDPFISLATNIVTKRRIIIPP